MLDNASDMGITIFMPHVTDIAYKRTADTARSLNQFNRGKTIIRLLPEMLPMLSYRLENPIEPDVIEHLFDKDLLAMLWSADLKTTITDSLTEFVRNVTEPLPAYDDKGNRISVKFPERILDPWTIYLEDNSSVKRESSAGSNDENASRESQVTQSRSILTLHSNRQSSLRESRRVRFSLFDQIEGGRLKLTVPAVWTPANQAGNATFMYTFFRNVRSHRSD